MDIERDLSLPTLSTWRGPPGRFEHVDADQPFAVIVDFAHTPDALVQLLGTVRAGMEPTGELTVVFGLGGAPGTLMDAWDGLCRVLGPPDRDHIGIPWPAADAGAEQHPPWRQGSRVRRLGGRARSPSCNPASGVVRLAGGRDRNPGAWRADQDANRQPRRGPGVRRSRSRPRAHRRASVSGWRSRGPELRRGGDAQSPGFTDARACVTAPADLRSCVARVGPCLAQAARPHAR